MRADIAAVIEESDVLVVGLSDPKVAAALREGMRPEQTVVDLVNMPGREALPGRYIGLCWH